MRAFSSCLWPKERAADALLALARRAGYATQAIPAETRALPDLEQAARFVGLELDALDAPYAGLERALEQAGACLVEHEDGLLLLLARGRRLRALGPNGRWMRIERGTLAPALCGIAAAETGPTVDFLKRAHLAPPVLRRIHNALAEQHLAETRLAGIFRLRLPAAAPASAQVRALGGGSAIFRAGVSYVAQYGLWLLASWMLARLLSEGRSPTWAWALALAAVVPLRAVFTGTLGGFAVRAGATLRNRLFAGALALEPEETRGAGIGRFLGHTFEAQTLETFALGGGFAFATAVLELVGAGAVLALLAAAWLQVFALLAWSAVTTFVFVRYRRRQWRWANERLELTHGLIESMIGHRTRLAQGPCERAESRDQDRLAQYRATSAAMDAQAVSLAAFIPRGWLLLGLSSLMPALVRAEDAPRLAAALAGTFLAYQAFRRAVVGLTQLAGAKTAWTHVSELWRAAARLPPSSPGGAAGSASSLLQARELSFCYPERTQDALDRVSLTVEPQERLLLRGPAGSGKSTLVSIFGGVRLPDKGSLWVRGGKQTVASAAQFQDNHIFAGSVAFNVLLGRAWPPRPEDLAEAEQICRALQLGPLLERMPSGIQQYVGETGWQLSHGEKSRLYIARALLQRGAELIVLDESFATLDPQTLRTSVEAVKGTPAALLVVAHS